MYQMSTFYCTTGWRLVLSEASLVISGFGLIIFQVRKRSTNVNVTSRAHELTVREGLGTI